MVKELKEMLDIFKSEDKLILSVAAAEDKEVLQAVKDAVEKQIIEPILVGDSDKIKFISEEINFDLTGIKILNSNNIEESARIAVELVSTKNADFVMKGILDTLNSFKIRIK